MSDDFNMEELIKRIQEEEEYVKTQTLSYQEYLPEFIAKAKEDLEIIEISAIELEKDSENFEVINAIFRSFHNIKGSSGFVGQEIIQKLAHQTETLLDGCRKGTVSVTEGVVNIILKSTDIIKEICDDLDLNENDEFTQQVFLHIKDVEQEEINSAIKAEEETQKLGEMLVEEEKLKPEDVEEIIEKQKTDYPDLKFGQVAVKEGKAKAADVYNAVTSQKKKTPSSEEFMRISTDKVDNLVDMVGELVITQSLVEQQAIAKFGVDNSFIGDFNRMTRTTKELQALAMDVRMVPLKSTFQKITRIARDTIRTLQKDVEFSTSGEDTEIDRIVTDKLMDPLVHLVKNAISHGIEGEEERLKAGKSAIGKVTLSACNKRGSIYIDITDDGGGINAEKVYKKALDKGLIDPNKEYTEKEIQEFIMLPGLSTMDVANNVSGRGVGMDVVRTEIQKNGGKVEIKSEVGKGSVFSLKIPVNHAIMNGTVIDIEGTNYILPTLNVKQIIQPTDDQWVYMQNERSRIKVREDIIPLISIEKFFETRKEEEEPALIIIIEMDQKFRALPVRNVIGRQEVVVKPAGEEFSKLNYIAGMSILGDGKVSLILDIENMFNEEKT